MPLEAKHGRDPKVLVFLLQLVPDPEKMLKTMTLWSKVEPEIVPEEPLRYEVVMTYAYKPGIVTHTFKPSTWEAEAG